VLVRGAKGTNRLVLMSVRREVLMKICLEGFIYYGDKLETNSAVNR